MAILIINRFPSDKVDYYSLLEEKKESLVLLTTDDKGFDKKKYNHVQVISNFNDITLEYNTLVLSKKYSFSSVVALSEYDLVVAAKIRESLNLNGQSVHSAVAYRDKIIMKEYAKSVVKVPACQRISSGFDIDKFVEQHDFPVVIKPIDGAGSTNTYIINNQNELDKVIESNNLINFEIEKFIEGEMYKVDGIYLNGKIMACWASKYVNDCLSFKDGKQATYAQLNDEDPLNSDLICFCELLLSSLPTPKNTTFHAEIIHSNNGDLVLCEIASRTGGGSVAEVSELLFGINITNEWVKGQAGLNVSKPKFTNPKKYGVILIPPQNKKLIKLPPSTNLDWVDRLIIQGEEGKTYTTAGDSVDSIITALISDTTSEGVIKKMEYLTKWLEERCEWE